jgi:hypothetical protein
VSCAYALEPQEVKERLLRVLGNTESYTVIERAETVAYPQGEDGLSYPRRLSVTYMDIDFAHQALYGKTSTMSSLEEDTPPVDNEFYVLGGHSYQQVSNQWVKIDLGVESQGFFKALEEEKSLIAGGQVSIIHEDPWVVLVMPNPEQFLSAFIGQFRFFSAPGAEPDARLERLSMQYWLDDNFKVLKKDISAKLVLGVSSEPMTVEYHTRSEISRHNEMMMITLPPEALQAQFLNSDHE